MKRSEAGEASRLLDKPRILYPEPGGFSQALFYGALLLLGAAGSLGCLFGAFQVPLSLGPVAASGAACLGFCLALFAGRRPSWIVSLAGLGVWIGLVFFLFEDLIQGCAHTVNRILEAYGEKLGVALPILLTQTQELQQVRFQCTVFCCLCLFPYLFFLGWFLAGRKSGLGAFCLTGLAVSVPMVISLVPPAPFLGALLLFWLALLLFSSTLGRRHRLVEDKKGFHAAGLLSARPAALALLPAAALCMVLTGLLFPQEGYQRPRLAAELREGLTHGFGLEAALKGGVGNSGSQVRLDSLGSRSYTGETVLRVRYQWENLQGIAPAYDVSNREKDYLKSFVGSEYTGRSWERLSSQDWRELKSQLEGICPQTLMDRFRQLFYAETPQAYTLWVENLEGNPRCLYTPYGLWEESVDLESMEYVEDGFLQSSRVISGTSSYTLSAWGVPDQKTAYPARVANAILSGFLREKNLSSLEAISSEEMGELMRVLAWIDVPTRDEAGNALPWREVDLWTVPQEALAYLTPEQQAAVQGVEAYTRFAYDHYTQLPQELLETLRQYLEENVFYQPLTENTVDAGSNSPVAVARRIANTLAAQCAYTLSPPVLPEGEDFVEYFLFESRQGYCVHFATAAVALLRAAGISARYAEGYAVPSGQEGWVNVPDYNAHAWVEIYLGGTGWVPVEVTPAGPDAPAATQDALPTAEAATPSPSPSPSPSPTPTAEPTPEAASPTPGREASPTPEAPLGEGAPSGDSGPGNSGLWAVLGVLCGLLAVGGALLLRRGLVLAARERRYAQRDRNKGALALYAHLLDLYREARRLPQWEGQPSAPLEELARKARFSQHALTREEVSLFREEAAALESQLRESLPLGRRLWLQIGPILF